MRQALGRVGEYLWIQSLDIILVAILVGFVCWVLRKSSAHWRYLLWLVALCKCAIPAVFLAPLGSFPGIPVNHPYQAAAASPDLRAEPEPGAGFGAPLTAPEENPAVVARPNSAPRLQLKEWVIIVWAGIVLLYLTYALIKATWFESIMWENRLPVTRMIRHELDQLFGIVRLEERPEVWVIPGAAQPFVWGLWRGNIYLPEDFVEQGTPAQRRAILMHEVAHVLRRDSVLNLIQILIQAFFFFHPLVWWINSRIRHEREKCCDETAMATLKLPAHAYTRAMIDRLVAQFNSDGYVPSLAISSPARDLEDRITTVHAAGRHKTKGTPVSAAIAALLLAIIILPLRFTITETAWADAGLNGEEEHSHSPQPAVSAQPPVTPVVSPNPQAEVPGLDTESEFPASLPNYRTYQEPPSGMVPSLAEPKANLPVYDTPLNSAPPSSTGTNPNEASQTPPSREPAFGFSEPLPKYPAVDSPQTTAGQWQPSSSPIRYPAYWPWNRNSTRRSSALPAGTQPSSHGMQFMGAPANKPSPWSPVARR
jgi:beta-lactamase regulating signal transducer with metallopeptidase domain